LPAPRRQRLDEYRVGYWFDESDCPIAFEYRAVVEEALEHIRGAASAVDDSHPPVSFTEQTDLWLTLVSAASALSVPEEFAEAAGGSHRDWLVNHEKRQ